MIVKGQVMVFRKRYRLFQLLGLLLLMILFTACTQETDITFLADEEWVIDSKITLNPSVIPDIGMGVPLFEGFGISASTSGLGESVIDGSMNLMINEWSSLGIIADWQKQPAGSHDVTYMIQARGSGYARLVAGSQDMFAISPIPGTDQYHLQGYLEDPTGLSGLFKTTIRIHAGKIISSNSLDVSGGTATWINPTMIDVVFVPKTPIGSLPIAIACGVIGLGVSGFVVWLMLAKSSRSRSVRGDNRRRISRTQQHRRYQRRSR